MSNNESTNKKPYNPPRLTVHGDIEVITQGVDLGAAADAAFTTSVAGGAKGRKKDKPKKDRFS
jgi:hypothetical protein